MQTSGDLIKDNSVEEQKLVLELVTKINNALQPTDVGVVNGVGSLDSDGKQPISEIRSADLIPISTNVISDYILSEDNIYYGFKSAQTGLDISVIKTEETLDGNLITDSDIDNIVYFKFSDGNYGTRIWPGNVINIKEFGAKGDGITDNTVIIQKVMSILVKMGGGDLFVPSGIYLSAKIDLVSRINIKGEGKGVSVIKLLDNQNTDLLWIPKTSFINNLENITFQGNREVNTTSGTVINLEANTNADGGKVDALFDKSLTGTSTYRYLSIREVCVTGGCDYGLFIPAANYIVHIDGLYAYKNRRGFENRSTDNIFTNILAERNDIFGIKESGGNNKWSNLKVIWNGIARTEPGFIGFFGGLLITSSSRSVFTNGESQDNWGHGVWIVSSKYIIFNNYISDSNGYLNNTLVTDGTSSGFRLDDVQDSEINGFATNYKNTLARPWPQTRGWSEDRRCNNNKINIRSIFQENTPTTTSENMVNTHDLVCKRNNTYVGIDKTFEIDEPVIENGVLITENDRISVPCIIPIRNELSFVFDFEYQLKTSTTPILIGNDVFKLEYITGGAQNHLLVTFTTEQGEYTSNQLNFTLTGGVFYRVYCGLRRLSSSDARIDLSISYTANGGIYQDTIGKEISAVSQHLFGVINNLHFNNYDSSPGSPIGNIQMRLIKFALFPKVLPADYTKFNYKIMNLEEAYMYFDFVKPFGNRVNVIKTDLTLPAPSIYYLNKYFITNEGLFVCIQLPDTSYTFIGLTKEIGALASDLLIRPEKVTVTDFNTVNGYKFLVGTDTATNSPVSGQYFQGIQFAMNNSDAYTNQIVYDINGTAYTRNEQSNVWSQWERVSSFSPIVAKTSAYTATIFDRTITGSASSGAFTITLPPLSQAFRNGEGIVLEFKKTDSSANAILIDGSGAETVEGSTGFSLTIQNQTIRIKASSTGWILLDQYIPNPLRVVSVSGSGDGSSTAIVVTHGLGYVPVIANVLATNSAAAGIKYVTATSTTFTVNYDVAPPTGTNNLLYNFSYRRP